jgi:DNA-binding response OmpR family regulator
MNAAVPKPTILVVDDEFLIAAEIEAILAEHGFNTEIATTRQQGLASIGRRKIDLAIVDVHLGVGVVSSDLTDELDAATIPYVICTGSTADETEERFTHATIVSKPFLAQQIVDAVRSKLSPVQPS